jgi:gamma-glutamyltranspeptidase/glutathione hydrolase
MRCFTLPLSWPTTLLIVAVCANALPALPVSRRRSTSLPPLSGKNGGIATEVGHCSDIGVEIMKAGGNAADAIIASGLCVGTVAAYHSGIGGGGFMLVRFNKEGGGHDYEMVSSFSLWSFTFQFLILVARLTSVKPVRI